MKKKPAKSTSAFWYWSNWKGIASSRGGDGVRERVRTIYEPTSRPQDAVEQHFDLGSGPVDPATVPVFQGNLEIGSTPDDCPWPLREMFIVSDRLRHLLEAVAPSNCQFFPMRVTHNGEPCDLVYWRLYVEAVDCADSKLSGYNHEGLIADPFVVEGRVPLQTSLFRAWDPIGRRGLSGILVRDSLRRTLVREKISGCMFYRPRLPAPIEQSS